MNPHFDPTQPEGQRVEYKSAASLEKPRDLAHTVAAMLNAGGGTVWIGIREESEVPTEVEGVAEAALDRRRLEDTLCDTLEPAWSASAGAIGERRVRDKTVLFVHCHDKVTGAPFAVLGSGGREFPIRVGARIRRMSRDELARAFAATPTPERREIAMPVIEEFRRLVTDRSRFSNRFWILATPDEDLALPFQEDGFRTALKELLSRPEQSGNRHAGFNVISRFVAPALRDEAARIGEFDDQHWSLAIDGHGTLKFHVPLDVPAFNTPFRHETALWPFALCELVASFVRVLNGIYELGEVPGPTPVVLDVGLVGARSWTLGPHSPDSISYHADARPLEKDEILWSDPLRTTRAELGERDLVAWRAVTRIYREFGHDGDVLPREWNRETKRLHLPE